MSYKDLVNHLKNEGIINDYIANAMLRTPRKNFLPEMYKKYDGFDTALPLGHGQTISQPSVVAHMLTLLDIKNRNKVLEIGVGSGWVAAIMSHLGKEIIGVENVPELYKQAKERLKKYKNVKVVFGDGSCGWQEYAPYDRILISAAVPKLSEEILNQLADDGYVVAPIGPLHTQLITKLNKNGEKIQTLPAPVVFVPLIGKCGYKRDELWI